MRETCGNMSWHVARCNYSIAHQYLFQTRHWESTYKTSVLEHLDNLLRQLGGDLHVGLAGRGLVGKWWVGHSCYDGEAEKSDGIKALLASLCL